jgi:hypothetical protein
VENEFLIGGNERRDIVPVEYDARVGPPWHQYLQLKVTWV